MPSCQGSLLLLDPDLDVYIFPDDSCYALDYLPKRVRLFVDRNGVGTAVRTAG